jgi:hypothetical protein
MKFVTSRIVSPKQVRSLREIIEDNIAAQQVKTASSEGENLIKTAGEDKSDDEKPDFLDMDDDGDEEESMKDALEDKKKSKDKDKDKKEEKEASSRTGEEIKSTTEKQLEEDGEGKKASADKVEVKTASLNKFPSFTFRNIKEAKLTSMDAAFLRKYFAVYYPPAYIDALLAEYF